MLRTLFSIVLMSMAALAASDTAVAGGLELQYTGSLSQLSRTGDATAVKQFDLYVLKRGTEAEQQIFSIVNERGGGGWAWPERYGQLTLNEVNKRSGGRPAHLLHTHDGVKYPIELPSPVFEFANRVAANATWTSGKLAWEVVRERKVANRDTWQVDGVDNFGRRRSVFVARDSAIVVAAEQKVFMGRGDEFLLRIELSASREVPDNMLEPFSASVDALLSLQSDLNREEGETSPELSEQQLQRTGEAVKQLTQLAEATPLKNLVVAIARDVDTQTRRSDDIASIAKRFIGQPAPDYLLNTIKKDTISSRNQQNRITVLHFWNYVGEPLEEPYGQVGYLDFIANRRGRFNVDVVGVAVDERFADPTQQGAALRSVRKLRDFMNLSYPIATDSGTTLKSFGDPRSLGAALPVWVVIGPDRKIAHYHVGAYTLNPDEGLAELDAVLIRLIRESRSQTE